MAFATDVNPAAALGDFQLLVFNVPHSVSYPDMPTKTMMATAVLESTQPFADVNYGTLAYGQFLDSFWKEFRRAFYIFDVGSEIAVIQTDVPVVGSSAGPITPIVSPPKSPRVNGNDAFVRQTGVGLQPTISWSPPATGSATSYVVDVLATALPCDAGGKIAGVSAVIHSGTSFKVPPGILRSGLGYRVIITARQAPWDTPDVGPFRTGTPLHSAQCVTAQFVP
jgi:hypothetical protein